MDPMLEAFAPHLNGVYNNLNINLGGETWIRWLQLYSLFQVGQLSYEDLAKQYEPFYKERGHLDFMELQRDWRRSILMNEQFLSSLRADALLVEEPANENTWVKYRMLTSTRQVLPEIAHARQVRLVEEAVPAGEPGPYEYGPATMARIRAHLGLAEAAP